jgi:hypothetical protein
MNVVNKEIYGLQTLKIYSVQSPSRCTFLLILYSSEIDLAKSVRVSQPVPAPMD